MTERQPPLLAKLKDEIDSLRVDLGEMVRLRWELAQLELRTSARTVRHTAIALIVVAAMALSVLPTLTVAAAEALQGRLGIPCWGWLLLLGGGLAAFAAVGGYFVRQRFRRRFVGLEQTFDELREDLVWLKEWTQGEQGREDDGKDQ